MNGRTVLWVMLGDLGRSGVPMALERMVRWLATKGPGDIECHVVAGRDGPLASALAQSATSVTALEPEQGRSPLDTVAAAGTVLGQPGPAAWPRDRWHRHVVRALPRPDVVLVQGAGAWQTAQRLGPQWEGAHLVLHLHELDVALSRSGLTASDPELFSRPDTILAVCRPVAELAVARGAASDRLGLVAGSVDAPPLGWDHPQSPTAADAVLSVGQAGWRKGTDRAVAAAWELQRVGPGLDWHWIGAEEGSAWATEVGRADPLVRHGEVTDPWATVHAPAGLVIPSREDPLPLVALEAGARSIPVIATRTGGLMELLGDGRGVTVDGTDLHGLVAAVRALVEDPEAANERAGELRRHVRMQYATEVVGPRWLDAVLDRG